MYIKMFLQEHVQSLHPHPNGSALIFPNQSLSGFGEALKSFNRRGPPFEKREVGAAGVSDCPYLRLRFLGALGRSSSTTAKLIFFSTGSMRSTITRRRSPMR